jgi:hypothetical protein
MARGFQVLTTREGNVNLTADQRAQIANHAQAAVCLSLHATEAGAGVHIFVSSLAPEVQGRFLAWKTAQAAYVTRSLKLASVLNSSFEHGSNNGTQGSDGGQNAADSNGNADSGTSSDTTSGPIPTTLTRTSLPGVDSMTCPALAVEIAPLRGDDHNVTTDVTDEQYQTQVVEDMAAAVLEWRTEWDSELHPENKLENKLENNLENRLVKQSGIKMELIKPGVRPEIKLEMIKPGEKPGEKPGAKPGAKPGEMPGKPASAQAGGKPRIQPGAGKSSGNGGAAPARSQQP